MDAWMDAAHRGLAAWSENSTDEPAPVHRAAASGVIQSQSCGLLPPARAPTRAQFTRTLAPNAPATKAFDPPQELKSAAQAKAGGRAFRLLKWGGRIFLVIAIAADAYEIYEAENKAKTITKKAGAWTGATLAGGAAATKASPLLAGGPWGWAGYGAIVGGAGILGYIAGGEITETIYEWTLE
jgi:hypothetical protein